MDPRNSLVFEFARLVCEMQPKTLIMEEVPAILNMVTPDGLPVVDTFCRILEDRGFGGYDAVRRNLYETSGSGAALRSRIRHKKSVSKQKDSRQTDLFTTT